MTKEPTFKQKVMAWLQRVRPPKEVLESKQEPEGCVSEVKENLDLLYDTLENPSDSDMEDNDSAISTHKPKGKPYFKGLSYSSWQMKTGRIHSTWNQEEPQSLADVPEKTWAPGGKQSSDRVSESVASSTSTPQVAKIWSFSPFSQHIKHEDSTIQASPQDKSMDHYSEGESESLSSE